MTAITSQTLGEALNEVAAKYPDNEAIVFRGQRLTYRETREKADALAKGLLRLGIGKGDNVAIWMGNCPEWIITQYAVSKTGAALVPINTRNRIADTEYILRQSDAKVLVLADRFLGIGYMDMLREMIPELDGSNPGDMQAATLPNLKTVICSGREPQPGTFSLEGLVELGSEVSDEALASAQSGCRPDDVVLIVYTSGTTGAPKGAMLTNRNTLGHMVVYAKRLDMTAVDRMLFSMPLFHSGGCVFAVMSALATASTICLMEVFEPREALQLIQDERCTLMGAVPSILIMMLDHPDFDTFDVSSMRTSSIGGAPVPVELMRVVMDKLVKHVVNAYGLTEGASVQLSTLLDDPPELICTTVGVPLADNEIALFDPATNTPVPVGQQGEIRVRGPVVTKGYYKNPEETAQAIDKEGWLHTGDLGIQDSNGYYRITGRTKDMFIVGGSNVYPAEIENFLSTHPKVKQVHVVGVPDYRLGEVGMAVIELKGNEVSTCEEVIDFCKGKLANYKIPRYVKFASEFPMTASGKVQKFKLREEFIAKGV